MTVTKYELVGLDRGDLGRTCARHSTACGLAVNVGGTVVFTRGVFRGKPSWEVFLYGGQRVSINADKENYGALTAMLTAEHVLVFA